VEFRDQKDNIGSVIRNVPSGLRESVFDKMEALFAHAMPSLPATKGFEIGSGFEILGLRLVKRSAGSGSGNTSRIGTRDEDIRKGNYIHRSTVFTSPAGKMKPFSESRSRLRLRHSDKFARWLPPE
jgi:hypothetical protein